MNEYTKVGWQDGTVLQQAKVTIDGTDYEVTPAVESGTTPVNATNLDKMDTALKQAHDGVRNVQTNKIDKATLELLTVDSTAPEHCSTGDMYYNTTTNFIYTAIGTDTWGETGETPSSKYLYVDLTNSKLYYYDGTNFTSYGGGANLSNVYGTSNANGYTQEYINGIIESGSNENGNYIKFADGTLICTIIKTINIAINTAWGSLYVGDINTKYTYPVAFVGNNPVVNYSITGYNSAFVVSWIQSSNKLVETDRFALVRGNTASAQDYVLNITAIGRWK